jgi:glycosyltransferase involved in cell wall biosynthesis
MPSLVSVIVPAYNCAATIAETLESVLAQDYGAIELIVVNDGSKDHTLEVLRGFGGRIRVVDQANAGPPAARNAGIAAARGEYIAFIDADDIWLPGKVSAQVRHLETHPEVGTTYTAWHVWEPDGNGRFSTPGHLAGVAVGDDLDPALSGWLYDRLLFTSELLTSTVLLRRSLAERVGGFDLALWNGDDYDYWIRLSREAKISKLASVGVLYRQLPGSVSRSPKEVNFELEVISRALRQWGPVGPDGRAVDARRLAERLEALELAHGYAHLQRGNPQIAWKVYCQAAKRRPTRLSYSLNAVKALWRLAAQAR